MIHSFNAPSTNLSMDSYLSKGTIFSTHDDRVMIGYGKREWMASPKSIDQPAFYFPDFFLKTETPWFQHEITQELPKNLLLKQFPLKNHLQNLQSPQNMQWQIQGDRLYSKMFASLMQAFCRKRLQKAVPYLFYAAKNSPDLPRSLGHLIEHSMKHPAYVYGFWDEEKGILGGTPELLFQMDASGILTTDAIAGTAPSIHEEQLLANPKFKLEHDLVVEGMVKSLIPFGKVEVGEREILRLPTLSHSKTAIRVKLNSNHPIKLHHSNNALSGITSTSSTDSINAIIRALHPTPALGAFPKEDGHRWLQQYDRQLSRGRYGAPIGLKYKDRFYCYVGIRNVQWDKRGMRIGVGGGVVESSDKDSEKRELALKFQSVRSLLNL